jgi:hypothetical protein
MLTIALLILTLFIPQQSETVAITLSPESSAIILPRKEAEAQFKQLCADGTDDQRLKALAATLNPMPDWPQMVMNGDSSVCNRNPKALVPVPLKTPEAQR